MNIIFGAQGSILNVFNDIDKLLKAKGDISQSFYWVSDSEFYNANSSNLDVIDDNILKEWEYTNKDARSTSLSFEIISCLEERYGEIRPIWNSVVADRRLMFGEFCKSKQDYKTKFNHQEIQNIIYNSLKDIDELFDKAAPDLVVTFVPVTFGDYLLNMVAEVRGIKCLILRSAKINNFVTFSETVTAYSDAFANLYNSIKNKERENPFSLAASEFLTNARKAPLEYEGSVISANSKSKDLFKRYCLGFAGVIRDKVNQRNCKVDNHVPGKFNSYLHSNLLREYKIWKNEKILKSRTISLEEIDGDFVFFPMHSEPEIALSVYGIDHQNQIETIRRVAQSIPIHWKVIVKEHPRSVSYRSEGYYNALLNIPNVYFAPAKNKPYHWILKAKIITVISGFVGIEASILGKPVIVLGDVNFSLLPPSMVRNVDSMKDYYSCFKELIESYKIDDSALISYISASMYDGVAVNLYSDLLKKSSRISGEAGSYDKQISDLANSIRVKANINATQ
ncbi:capsular polysaccharide export protein, LipB/KpsS family [Marinomonas sp. PE14-40]|uniref:capsular polysaccharide export protein, LipB/KpsS family n=1 Tax=Marinomonas sp. PE14-40 TaxID=3060621 RepID=UPI003F678255